MNRLLAVIACCSSDLTFLMNKLRKLQVLLNPQNHLALVVLLLCGLMGWWLMTHSGFDLSSPLDMMRSVNRLGWIGILLFICVQALAIVISPIPGTPLTVAGGLVWGPIPAGIYGVIGIYLGSLVAYFIGRTLGRSAVQTLTGKVIYLSKQKGELYLGWVMFVSHLLPVLPFDLMSYGAGISGLSLPVYASATLLGTIPCTFLLTHLGSAVQVSVPIGIAIAALFVVLLIGLPWGIQRHNWLGLRDIIRVE